LKRVVSENPTILYASRECGERPAEAQSRRTDNFD
jgi:hypothetical protein